MEPLFLTLEEVLEIHLDQIHRYGGMRGIRDKGLLQSAIAVPMSGSGDEFHHKDIVGMASAYLFHIVKNHPFIDGNKRVGAVAAYVFLILNGYGLEAGEGEFEELILGVADGSVDKPQVAEFFRKHARPV